MTRPTLSAGKFWGLRRLADAAGRFKMLAVDRTAPIEAVVRARRDEAEARADDVRAIARVLVDALGDRASAVVVEPTHALADALTRLDPAHGLAVALDAPHPAATPGGRRSAPIADWSVAKSKRVGADAVKLLVWYRPDQDAATRAHQEDLVQRTAAACARYDIPLALALRLDPPAGADPADAAPQRRADHVLDSVERFAAADFGVDLFALESPWPAAAVPAPDGASHDVDACRALFDELGRRSGRPWVVLSAGAAAPAFHHILQHACHAGASGYLAGRAIWWDGVQAFPDLALVHQALATGASDTMRGLNALADRHARPWTDWYGAPVPAGWDSPAFPRDYPSF